MQGCRRSAWRDLPERHDPPATLCDRFSRWAKAEVRVRVFETLAERSPHSLLPTDGSIIRAPRQVAAERGGADHALGRSRGGSSTKINAMVDARGLPVAVTLTPGQAPDKAAEAELFGAHPGPGDGVADRGHGARGGRCHVPTQRDCAAQRSVDPALCRWRDMIEKLLNKFKRFRKMASRCEKTAGNHLAAVFIAARRPRMRHCASASWTWADGVQLQARTEPEAEGVLALLGATPGDGRNFSASGSRFARAPVAGVSLWSTRRPGASSCRPNLTGRRRPWLPEGARRGSAGRPSPAAPRARGRQHPEPLPEIHSARRHGRPARDAPPRDRGRRAGCRRADDGDH